MTAPNKAIPAENPAAFRARIDAMAAIDPRWYLVLHELDADTP